MSNGKLHIIDHVNFSPFTCWHDTIRVQGEILRDGEGLPTGSPKASESLYAYSTFVPVDREHALYGQISGSGVTVFEPKYPTSEKAKQPEFHFYANNILSGNYRISIVLVPPHLLDPEVDKSTKKNYFKAYMEVPNSDGTVGIKNLAQKLTSNPEKVDTIVLAENFKMDFCEESYKSLTGKDPVTRLVIQTEQSFSTRSHTTAYRIDQVMFEPVDSED